MYSDNTFINAVKTLPRRGVFRVLHFGVGGGSDIILSHAHQQYLLSELSHVLPKDTKVDTFLVNAKNGRPKESAANKFKDWREGLYIVEQDNAIDLKPGTETNRTLLLESFLSTQFHTNVYVADVDNENLLKTLCELDFDLLIAVDTGGDSLVKESIDDKHRDQQSIDLLQGVKNASGNKVPLVHAVVAPGIDGETTVKAMNEVLQKLEKEEQHTIEPIDPLVPYLKYWETRLKDNKTARLIIKANEQLRTGEVDGNDMFSFTRFFSESCSMPYFRTAQIYRMYYGFPSTFE